jgi:hypothetical protein
MLQSGSDQAAFFENARSKSTTVRNALPGLPGHSNDCRQPGTSLSVHGDEHMCCTPLEKQQKSLMLVLQLRGIQQLYFAYCWCRALITVQWSRLCVWNSQASGALRPKLTNISRGQQRSSHTTSV